MPLSCILSALFNGNKVQGSTYHCLLPLIKFLAIGNHNTVCAAPCCQNPRKLRASNIQHGIAACLTVNSTLACTTITGFEAHGFHSQDEP